MSAQDIVTRWQRKLDREFPHGLVMHWDEPDSPTYQVPRVTVTGAAGLDPLVEIPVFGSEDKTLGPARVLSYEVLREEPVLQVRVTTQALGRPMLWSALTHAISPKLIQAMEAERQRLISEAPDGRHDEGPGLA